MDDSEKQARIVEARMKLKARFESKTAKAASSPEPKPMGSGAPNRHGMPTIPVGQTVTSKWPVLDLGHVPDISFDKWTLEVDGEVDHPMKIDWNEFLSLPQADDISDFHCVTTWSKLNIPWKGVRFLDIAAMAAPKETVTHVMCYGYDGYSTNVLLEEALKSDVLLVHTVQGKPLPIEHGGPVRMITPQLYAWKGSKWIQRIEFMKENRPGFWEARGYSDTAYPWKNDRYR